MEELFHRHPTCPVGHHLIQNFRIKEDSLSIQRDLGDGQSKILEKMTVKST